MTKEKINNLEVLEEGKVQEQSPEAVAISAETIHTNEQAQEQLNKAELLSRMFPNTLPSVEEIFETYPPRELPEGAIVSRIAPSPTGMMHIGGIYAAMISERLARQSDGVFYLRIEDTDQKRQLEGATEVIVSSLNDFGVVPHEGEVNAGEETGAYGPYKQSARKDIYQAFIRDMVEKGIAYPCFSTEEEINAVREEQTEKGLRTGYYGEWSPWREKSSAEALEAMDEGKDFVVRFKSQGDFEKKIPFRDQIKGQRELSENDLDIVIMKKDGLPTYHLAHVVDDHLMGTTHVVRGDEWLSSAPLHVQLFDAMGWKAPKYGHIMPIQKMDGETSKRKLSKRKDPEASVGFYDEEGYPRDAVIEYLLNLANSDFEQWRKNNPEASHEEFPITLKKLSKSKGALFDFNKLNSMSKDVISRLNSEEVYAAVLEWAETNDPEFAEFLKESPERAQEVFALDRDDREPKKRRKDITCWSEVAELYEYLFNDNFEVEAKHLANTKVAEFAPEVVDAILRDFLENYDASASKEEWFAGMKEMAEAHGFAIQMKKFKKNPEDYTGSIAHFMEVFRVLLTGRAQTPDLYSIMNILGEEKVRERLEVFLAEAE